nr:ATP synthase F0 subunit 8 [Sinoscolia sp. 1 GYN-2023a]
MPQMYPLLWSFLYTYFIVIFMLMIIMIYYSMNMKMISKINFCKKIEINKINWKW